MKARKHIADQMTPLERVYAIEHHLPYDRILCIPFIGNVRCTLYGTEISEYWKSEKCMAEGEILAFNRFGFDRLGLGPNTVGITSALTIQVSGGEQETPVVDEYEKLYGMVPVDASTNPVIRTFLHVAENLMEDAGEIVPVEASIGGPFTIASFLRGIEVLLRDCMKHPDEVHRLLRIVVDSQKSCIDELAKYGVGIAMADPVANPSLIGPRFYEKFVFPYTKELTDYAFEKTGKKVSLHMCGKTYSIWKYLCQYQLNEISLDNIIDLERAAKELGEVVPIAGNVDPVEIILNGNREEIFEGVRTCIEQGRKSKQGHHLTSGCDIPDATQIEKIDWFMEAARKYGKNG